MTDLASFLFVAETATLVVASLLLVYPVVACARNVAHTRGLALLSASFFAVTATYVVTFFLDAPVVSGALGLLGATLAALGTWEFARPFVRTPDGDVGTTAASDPAGRDDGSGGFESAGDD